MLHKRLYIFLLIGIVSLSFFSCNQEKKKVTDAAEIMKPIVIEAKASIIPADSMPLVETFPAGDPVIIKAGNPTITVINNNIVQAGEPITLKEELPKILIPGVDGLDLPKIIPVTFKTVPCFNRPLQRALKPRTIEGSDYDLQYLDIEHGLPTNDIITIYQDKKGNKWFGTNGDGVIKYDGTFFSFFTTKEGLPNDWVRYILEDETGNIWFGTDGGLAKYDGNDFTWIIPSENTANLGWGINIRSMILDKKGNIWFGTFDAGLFKFDGKSFLHFAKDQGVCKTIISLFEDHNGDIWFGGNPGRLFKYNGEAFDQFNPEGIFDGVFIKSISEDKEGNIWIGSNNGLTKFNRSIFVHYTIPAGLPLNHINCTRFDRSGNLWIGTEGGGACKFDGNNFTYYTVKEGFRNNQVMYILQDRTGIIWFATFGGGLMRLNEKGFTHFSSINELKQTMVYSICEDRNGHTWFGTQNGNIIKYSGDNCYTYTQQQGFNGNIVRDIIQDRDGNMWFASQHGMICKFDGKQFAYYTPQSGLPYGGFFSLYEDKKGNIWMGMLHKGVVKFDGLSFTHFKLQKDDPYEDIWSILEDKKGNMWFSSRQGLLTKYDGKTFTFYKQFYGTQILQIVEDRFGNIWFISEKNGSLVKYDGKKFYQYTTRHGLIESRPKSLVQDSAGNLWMGTGRGLNYVELMPGGSREIANITRYNSNDGLIGEDFQENTAMVDSKGIAWWGTNKNINKLDASNISRDTSTPQIQLNTVVIKDRNTDIRHLNDAYRDSTLPAVFNKIRSAGTAKFFNYPINPVIPFELNQLAFYFSAIDMASTNKLKYSYMVEDLDDNWSDLSETPSADYRNIPYGKYIFKVKAIGAAQIWSPVFEYPFTIDPPWWHTWWFRSFLFLSVLISVLVYIRFRTNALYKRQTDLQLTVEKRTEQLRVSLHEKEGLLKEIHHRVKNNLEVISSLLMLQTKSMTDENAKAALTEGQSRVQSIALIHHKLYRTDDLATVEIKDFASDLYKQVSDVFKKPGYTIRFNISGDPMQVNTEMAVPIGLILNELFTNSFKYAVSMDKENIFSLQLSETKKNHETFLTLIFHDNGPGMPAGFSLEKTGSLGMKIIHLLMKQLGGNIKYYNSQGAVFEIQFPKLLK